MSMKSLINAFMSQERFAFAGISGDPKDFSRTLMREFVKRGYDPVPVNPGQTEIEGRRVYSSVKNIDPPVEAILIMTGPETAMKILNDCKEAGIKLVWLYRSIGKGAVSPEAIEFCEQNNIDLVPGYCPFMFFSNTGFIHRFHAFLMKIKGSYPEQ